MSISEKIVLIVDDMKLTRVKLSQICAELGIQYIYEAVDGIEALKTLANVPADLILSDWVMPRMNGIELLNEIRKIPQHQKTPVIFITAETDKTSIMRSVQSGVTDYIVKPFPDETVKQKIFLALKNSEKSDKAR